MNGDVAPLGAERRRLAEARSEGVAWKRWGPYLSERQWGTVREDRSANGTAWEDFPHDHARSRAYRSGEDGLAGFSDDKARLCFAVALWNGNDPILKERLFGLTNSEGNHGEDVKEYYFYTDATPSHSYMKYVYKYPQAAYPYEEIVRVNRERGRLAPEYELIDTGIFDDDRYFDVVVEYAKDGPEDILIRITAHNRGDRPAPLHILPTLWFRNTWSWTEGLPKPLLERAPGAAPAIVATHEELGSRTLWCEAAPSLMFTENETNNERLFGTANAGNYVKDAFDRVIVHNDALAANGERGTKAAAYYRTDVSPGQALVVRLRLRPGDLIEEFGADFDRVFERRIAEADEFYAPIVAGLDSDRAAVIRQALSGMLWSKQHYYFDVARWLDEHGANTFTGNNRNVRNADWFHMLNDDVISMPDKWEYPWYAAWDLAFHCIPLSIVDADFAKAQLELLVKELYQHPNGQLPAYEWNFSDVNPPVHAYSAMYVYDIDKQANGKGDVVFLERIFQKLLLNFTWWVNRKDREGRNIFEGGFLGLDNIGVFDRNVQLPNGGFLEQADGTAWMLYYCLSMLEMAVELSLQSPAYEDMVVKFVEHFVWIGTAMMRRNEQRESMWDEQDGFFYDVLRLPNRSQSMRVRSLVGLMPMCAVLTVSKETARKVPAAAGRIGRRLMRIPEVVALLPLLGRAGHDDSRIFSVLDDVKLRRMLARMLDESEFWGPYGIRSLSKYHEDHPYSLDAGGQVYTVGYTPAESTVGDFGGNSNWRGPVWLPMNAMIYRALLQYYQYYGDDFKVECPTGSGNMVTLFEVAMELETRLERLFLRDERGRRPVYGGTEKFQSDPYWRDYILFYEYFHGDNGAGIGASHQTGWTGLIAELMRQRSVLEAPAWLQFGRSSLLERVRQRDAAANVP